MYLDNPDAVSACIKLLQTTLGIIVTLFGAIMVFVIGWVMRVGKKSDDNSEKIAAMAVSLAEVKEKVDHNVPDLHKRIDEVIRDNKI